jgi:hypothetical protein
MFDKIFITQVVLYYQKYCQMLLVNEFFLILNCFGDYEYKNEIFHEFNNHIK